MSTTTFAEWRGLACGRCQDVSAWIAKYEKARRLGAISDGVAATFEAAVTRCATSTKPIAGKSDELATLEFAILEAGASLHLQGPSSGAPVPIARITDAQSFGIYHVDRRRLPLIIDDTLGEQVFDRLGRSLQPRHYVGAIRGRYALAFYSDARSLDSIGGDADAVRDALGLGEVDRDVHLLRIAVPAAINPELHQPTPFDAGSYWAFMPATHPSGPGYSLNLQTLKPGVPEWVSGPLVLDPSFDVSKIGRTSCDAARQTPASIQGLLAIWSTP